VQNQQTKASRATNAIAVWIVWWPAILLTLLSYYQYAKTYLLIPYARGLGLSDSSQLSAGQFLYVFSETIFTAGIVIPLATFIACYFIQLRVMTRIVLVLSLLLALLSYASLVSVSNTGTLLSWNLFLDSVLQGVQDPELASHYVSVRSATKLIIVLASICCAAVAVRFINEGKLAPGLQKLMGCVLLASLAILPSTYVFARLSADTKLESGFDLITQQIVVFLQLERDAFSIFDGLEIDQAVSLFQATVKAPQGQINNRYNGSESGSNLILISLETGPQKVVDFHSIARFKNLRRLAEKSLVAKQHYSTYPYTSDALFSMLGSMYPNSLRRHLLSETSLELDNNLESRRIGLFNAMNRSGYFVKAYMPADSVFEADSAMFSVLGGDEVFIPNKDNAGEQELANLVESAARELPGYEKMGRIDTDSLKRKLTDDIASLNQLLFDIKTMASTGQKFGALFLPRVGHAPWPNQEPERTLLETGVEIVLLQDKWIGRIVQTLEEAGIVDDTVIVVTADHGLRNAAEYPDLKPGVLNEISFRVPLIVYAPNALSDSIDIEHLTSHIDIAPTILSLLGIDDSLIYMLGSPIWDKRIANRRTYFLANDYLGVDGYFESEKFHMYRPMANATVVSESMYLQQSTAFSNDILWSDAESEDGKEIVSDILFQRSFQRSLKGHLLDSD